MTTAPLPRMPYSSIVGQTRMKLALELCYVEPRVSGVLVSGERGTGKSTAVRAFARMMFGKLPVTLPINATEDRVVGGWEIHELLGGKAVPKAGLLSEANGTILYVDEVNLLDDHIVNILLDVSSTNTLVVEREGLDKVAEDVRFTLVGTMNPEEGALRPQLLDRFGLMVTTASERDPETRRQILECVLSMDNEKKRDEGLAADNARREQLVTARDRVSAVKHSTDVLDACVRLSGHFSVDGHRGELMTMLAARALAALEGAESVTNDHLWTVAPLALAHRRRLPAQRETVIWGEDDDEAVMEVLARA